MTKARTLADMISDGVIGTTELADDVITPVKLDETGNYQMAQLGIGSAASKKLTVQTSGTYDGILLSNGHAQSAARLQLNNDDSKSIQIDMGGSTQSTYGPYIANTASIVANSAPLNIGTDSANDVGIYANLTEVLRVKSDRTTRISTSQHMGGATSFPSWSGEGGYFKGYYNGGGSGPYHRYLDIAALGDGSWGGIVRFITNPNSSSTGQERMRVDNQGNLLVGKTDTGIGTQGVFFGPNYSHITSTNDTPLALSRKSSDGTILDIRKDGTAVGKINVADSDNVGFLSTVSNHGGIICGTSSIVPALSGTYSNGATDIGTNTSKWRNAYFSGSVNAGGYSMDAGDFTLNRTDGFDNSIVLSTASNNANRNVVFQRAGGGPINGVFQFRGKVTKPDQPSFYAYSTGFSKSSGWDHIGASITNIGHNIGNHYATSGSNAGRFTAPVSGRYLFQVGGWSSYNGGTANERYMYSIYVNNVNVGNGAGGNYSNVDSPMENGSFILNLTAGQWATLLGFSAVSATWGGSTHHFHWSGHFLG